MTNHHNLTAARACLALLTFAQFILLVDAAFGKKRREAEEAARRESERLSKLVVIFGIEISKTVFYSFTGIMAVAIAGGIMKAVPSRSKKKRGNRPGVEGTLDVVIVGCGLPKKGMGWFHLTQLLEMPIVNVRSIVEPFFLNPNLCKKTPKQFVSLVSSLGDAGVDAFLDVDDLAIFTKPTMCLIAGRTYDNPKLFRQCVEKGASLIYLEKPGAPSVKELEQMKDLAQQNGVKVYIGYNKNVTSYVQKAIALSRQTEFSHVFFCHNNSYAPGDLPEVFSRNPEGMLKNMAIHELALLVTFFGVTVNTIEKFKVNTSKLFSEKVTVWKPGTSMPNPEYITDFSRVAFKITTKAGTNVSVMADRCGGNISFAVVKDEYGQEVQKFEFPDAETAAKIEEQVKADPEMMPYFFVQSNDYLELKNRVVRSFLLGKQAEGVATIHTGIEALKLAEYATEQLSKALRAK